MRLILLLFCLAALPASTMAGEDDPALRQALEALGDRPLVCADFEQKKFLRVLSHPLVSRGRMVFRRGDGVVWQVVDPFPAVVTLRPSSMTRWDENGRAQVLDYGRNPVFGALAGTLMAIVAGDLEALRENFAVAPKEAEAPDAAWHIVLTPRRPELARLVAAVEVLGGGFAREIRIAEGGGDRTVIGFTDVTYDTCRLSAAERAYFEK